MAASSIHSIFTGCRGHLAEAQKIKKVFKLDTFLKKAVLKIEVGRRLQFSYFKGVYCMRRQDPSQITGRHDPDGD